MAWNFQANGWLQTGAPASPEVWVFNTRMPGTASAVFRMLDPAKPVGVRIYGSRLLETCYEVIIVGANLVLRKITLGTAGAALATAAHGLLALDSYRLEVRWVAGVISVYLNGSSTLFFAAYDTGNDLGANTSWGFATSSNGARVAGVNLYQLVRSFAALADVLWFVCNGTLYASDSGPTGFRAIGAFFDASVRVVGTEGRQAAYIVGGGRIVKFDGALMSAAPHLLTAGKMPGQTALNTPPGVTTATVPIWYNDRLLLLEGTYAIGAAIGTDDNFDLTVDIPGKAFVWPSRVGEPLVGGIVASNNRLLLFARRSTWALSADPALGGEVARLSDNIGSSGPNSACLMPGGAVLVHADQGLIVIPAGGEPYPLSQDVLTDILQVEDATDTLLVSLVRDTRMHGVWVLLTPVDPSVQGRHIWYDERTGRLMPASDPLSGRGGGGFWPQRFGHIDDEPTCAVRYQGRTIMGTRTGKLLSPSPAASDDNGHDFTSILGLQLVRPEEQDANVILWEFSLIMGLGSGPVTITVFGGETPERAFDTTASQLWTGVLAQLRDSFFVNQSAPALVLRLSATGEMWALEAAQVEYGLDPLVKSRRMPALVPSAMCAPPAAAVTPDPGPGTGAGPGPGGGSGPCTACATWMGAVGAGNATDTIGGKPAYRLAGPNTLSGAQAEVVAAIVSLLAQNLCAPVSATNPKLWVVNNIPDSTDGDLDWTDQALSYSAFKAMVQGDVDADLRDDKNKTWYVYFRCDDQP